MKPVLTLLTLALTAAPLAGQADERAEALAAALEHALNDSRFASTPRWRILLDTLRTAEDAPDHSDLVGRLVRTLGFTPGISEDHCRRIPVDPWRYLFPIGLEVHGVDAIVRADLEGFSGDSAYVWVGLVSGSGAYLPGPRSYALRRDSAGWQVTPHLTVSHGHCAPRLFTVPIALAARAMLDELDAPGATCLDPTGYPLFESNAVAAALGAEVHGRYVPPPRPDQPLPEPCRDPCGNAATEWGSVLKVLAVEWPDEGDDRIRVTLVGRRTGGENAVAGSERHVRYTVRRTEGGWRIAARDELTDRPIDGGR